VSVDLVPRCDISCVEFRIVAEDVDARAWRERFLEENGLPDSEADLLPDKSLTIALNFGDFLNGQAASLISLFAIAIDIGSHDGGSPTQGLSRHRNHPGPQIRHSDVQPDVSLHEPIRTRRITHVKSNQASGRSPFS
jgi:hypothetical protein